MQIYQRPIVRLPIDVWTNLVNKFEQIRERGSPCGGEGAGQGFQAKNFNSRSCYLFLVVTSAPPPLSEQHDRQKRLKQGSHLDWKTWKNGKAFSSQGILNRLEKSGKTTPNTGKQREFQKKIICYFSMIFK